MAKRKATSTVIPESQMIDFCDIMEKNYIDYAMSVIAERALPDIRDNCKPVQRRVLYAMYELNLKPDAPFRKCARIVGDCMGKYHPHGDSSIYGALMNLSQEFKMNFPLIEAHGNNGSIDGDGYAAQRYVEARLSNIGWQLCQNLHPDIVPFVPNFDETETEPTVLPCKFPALLLNGNSGIAVGMTSEIPSHNLGELLDGALALLKKPKSTVKDLMQYVKGPDYPTGGIIVNQADLQQLYETGSGKVQVRAKMKVEEGSFGKTNLIVQEIPYSMSGRKSDMIADLIQLTKNRVLDEITDIRDESNKDEIRLVIEVKRDTNIQKFLNKLYTKSKLQTPISYNFLVLQNQTPVIVNLKDYLQSYLDFQKELIIRETTRKRNRAKERLEVLSGLLTAIDQIDAIIETIRYAKNVATAKKCLMTGTTTGITFKLVKNKKVAEKFAFSELQATAILDMRLQRLCGLEIKTLEKEKKELEKQLEGYEKILSSQTELKKALQKEIESLRQFDKKRKTKITNQTLEKVTEEAKVSDVTIAIDRFFYLKLQDGKLSVPNAKYCIHAKSNEKLCIFTDKGNLYQLKLSQIPKSKGTEKGSPLEILAGFKGKNENILLIGSDQDFQKKQIVFLLKSGYLKQVSFEEYQSNYKAIVATKLYDSELVDILAVPPKSKLKLKTNKRELSLDLSSIDSHKKSQKGKKILTFRKGEEIQSISKK